jgi:hypothetical protein
MDKITGSEQSVNNSSDKVLAAGATFTGVKELNNAPDVMITVRTDQDGIIYADFSNDGVNYDSTLSFKYFAGSVNPPIPLVKGARWFRVRFTNTSSNPQTFFRLTTHFGTFKQLTSSLSGIVAQTQGASIVRPIDFNLMVSKGLYQGHSITIKDGLNNDIDTASVPEDISSEGGIYAGFPSAAAVTQVLSDSASDTGTLFYFYLATADDRDYTFGSVTLNGTTPVSLPVNVFRCNFAYYESGGSAANVGTITMRFTSSPTTIFVTIPPGFGQSYCSAYSVPKGSSVFIDRVTASVRGATSGSVDGVFLYKTFAGSPRYRFPFEMSFGGFYFDDMDYSVRIPEQVDIIPRIITSSANNLSVKVRYRIMKVVE